MLSHEELSRGLFAWRCENNKPTEEIIIIAQQQKTTGARNIIEDIRDELERYGITVQLELTSALALPHGRFCFPDNIATESREQIKKWLSALHSMGQIRVEIRAVPPPKLPEFPKLD